MSGGLGSIRHGMLVKALLYRNKTHGLCKCAMRTQPNEFFRECALSLMCHLPLIPPSSLPLPLSHMHTNAPTQLSQVLEDDSDEDDDEMEEGEDDEAPKQKQKDSAAADSAAGAGAAAGQKAATEGGAGKGGAGGGGGRGMLAHQESTMEEDDDEEPVKAFGKMVGCMACTLARRPHGLGFRSTLGTGLCPSPG